MAFSVFHNLIQGICPIDLVCCTVAEIGLFEGMGVRAVNYQKSKENNGCGPFQNFTDYAHLQTLP